MNYINIETKEIVSYFQLKNILNASFPDGIDMSERGYAPIIYTEEPETQIGFKNVLSNTPSLYNGVWTYTWSQIPFTQEEIEQQEQVEIQKYVTALEQLYDSKANEKKYDNRITCSLRAGYPGPYQAEGLAFATWMDTCNDLGYQILAEVKAGTRVKPSVEEFIAGLPQLIWPN